MSVHDEWRREYTCKACDKKFREGSEYLHGPGICSPTIADRALALVNKEKKPMTPQMPRNIPLENFIELGRAIQAAGGEPFSVLENMKPFLEILASNKITIKAKHEPQLL
jgi:hypothetical protein